MTAGAHPLESRWCRICLVGSSDPRCWICGREYSPWRP